MWRRREQGLTLVELVIVMAVSSILFVMIPPLVFQGVKTLVFLPRALAVNQVADEVLHQTIEGGFSTLTSSPVKGLRFAGRAFGPSQSAIWLAQPNQVGYLYAINSGNQTVLIRLNQGMVTRSFPAVSCTPAIGQEEVLPYHAALDSAQVKIVTPTTPLFRYYDQNGVEVVTPGCPPPSTIRRIDIAFVARTGSGVGESDAKERVTSSIAIRAP